MSAISKPFFSVIIPTYNRAHLVTHAIECVLNQTFRNFELIIVDDGSTDNTKEVIAQIKDSRVSYIYQQNQGRSTARNTGVAAAASKYIIFLDSDDIVMPQWLECIAEGFVEPNVGVVCCGIEVFNIEHQTVDKNILPYNQGDVFKNQKGLFLAGTYALRKEIFEQVGGFAPEAAPREHTELALRLTVYYVRAGWVTISIDRPLVRYNKQPLRDIQSTQSVKFLLTATEYILNRHTDQLKWDHKVYATYCAIAGVGAARIYHYNKARHYFIRALCTYPREWRHAARFLLACVPALGQRFWLRDISFDSSN